ncbi:hypothetical protein H0H87_008956 [Tephrocybe sp. NHM501043]|nr:hypothetical protein H0H87_008956 [Tephrocybe sp. NHM501043]
MGAYVGNSNVQFAVVAIVRAFWHALKELISSVFFLLQRQNGPVIGIIFCMIVARAHRSVNNPSQQVSTSNSRSRLGQIGHVLRPLAVQITTQVIDNSDRKPADFGTPPLSPGVYSLQSVNTAPEMGQKEEV